MADFTYKSDKTYSYKDLRNQTKEKLEPLENKEITNKQTGIKAKITREETKKIISKKAIDKSLANGYTKEEHCIVAQDLENLFINAYFDTKHKDTKGREQETYRFKQNIIINNKPAAAKITAFVKEVGNNKIYTIELENLELPSP